VSVYLILQMDAILQRPEFCIYNEDINSLPDHHKYLISTFIILKIHIKITINIIQFY